MNSHLHPSLNCGEKAGGSREPLSMGMTFPSSTPFGAPHLSVGWLTSSAPFSTVICWSGQESSACTGCSQSSQPINEYTCKAHLMQGENHQSQKRGDGTRTTSRQAHLHCHFRGLGLS